MRDPGAFEPEWDAANRRFTVPSRCPYPDCAQPVDPLHADQSLAWCTSCERPYEVVQERPPSGAAPIELNRRPRTGYCTQTGRQLSGWSQLDWCEEGGGPGRSNCLPDLRGAIFGSPDRSIAIQPVEDWERESILDAPDPDDAVVSVLVVRGWVVAVTARGRIGLLDVETGEICPALTQPLAWPDGSTDPTDISYSVQHAPAFRGTRMVIVAPHQVCFRDLHAFMMGAEADSRPLLVEPDSGSVFLGPPLGVDREEDQLFCLLQGRVLDDGIHDPLLRAFTTGGVEVARQGCGAIARPPVFDRATGQIIWVQPDGSVSSLQSASLGSEPEPVPAISRPQGAIEIEVSDRPSLMVVPGAVSGSSELWLSSMQAGRSALFTAVLERDEGPEAAPVQWSAREFGRIGPMTGFAVGIGSRHRDNAAGQLLGIATSEQVALLQRFSTDSDTHPMQSAEAAGVRGSWDPPIISSAGVVARLKGKLVLDSQGLGWSGQFHPHWSIPGEYTRRQGIAMFGRRVLIGHGLGVRCYVLGKERREG